ncbi:hypothetical protein Leryth_002595 [Lithospermum erythrorhizon]|nr:hypothetical protein Leryth_002595 [Lithospermum erythrorhizon]
MGQYIQVNASDMNEAQNELEETISMETNIVNEIIGCTPPNEIPKMRRPYKKKIVKSINFPKDVKTLLETDIFNGIPVTYISWSREEQLRGLIHRNGYVCSCKSCNGYKVVKANDFEEHAGCKTKHPNNHIYFPNGKSIHEVVHRLKKTPRENICETIEELMEGHLNQMNFRKWGVKYEAGRF